MEINVLFFGVIAEVTGTGFKHYNGVKDLSDLLHRISDDFPGIAHYNFRIALNNQIIDGEHQIKSGDELAYIPPFEGG